MTIKQIIREELDNLKEDIVSGQSIVWHRTKTVENIELIKKNGFKIGKRNIFGDGIYACFELEHQLNKTNEIRYGKIIVECKVKSFKDFLILFPQEAKNVYGEKNWRIKDQLKSILGVNLYNQIWKTQPLPEKACERIDAGKYVTALGEEFNVFKPYIQGWVYNSTLDGKAVVCYNENNVIPLQYSEDDGNSWKPIVDKSIYNINKTALKYPNNKYNALNSETKYKLLLSNPKVAEKLDLTTLKDEHILGLLKKYPEDSKFKDDLLMLLGDTKIN